jgi:hypothetical protein
MLSRHPPATCIQDRPWRAKAGTTVIPGFAVRRKKNQDSERAMNACLTEQYIGNSGNGIVSRFNLLCDEGMFDQSANTSANQIIPQIRI